MNFTYDPTSCVATCDETGQRYFMIDSDSGTEIQNLDDPAAVVSDKKRSEIISGFESARAEALNRLKFKAILEKYFRHKYYEVARIISEKTSRNVSERAIQSWVIDPGASSYRKCPSYALEALQEWTSEHDVDENQIWSESSSKINHLDIIDSYIVRWAENQIKSNNSRKEQFRNYSIIELSDKIAEEISRLRWENAFLTKRIHNIYESLNESENFDGFRKLATNKDHELFSVEEKTIETIELIEEQLGEFAPEYGK